MRLLEASVARASEPGRAPADGPPASLVGGES
jgi:hypothetical protein